MSILLIGILFIILLPVGAVKLLLDHRVDIISGFLIIAGFIAVISFFYKLVKRAYQKTENGFLWLGFAIYFVLLFITPLNLYELQKLKRPDVFNAIEHREAWKMGIFLFIVFLMFFLALYIAFSFKRKAIQTTVVLIPVIVLFASFLFSIKGCVKSNSEYIVQDMKDSNDLAKYTLKEDAKIYYTGYKEGKNNIYRFPLLSPIKYSCDSFQKGEQVYVDVNSWKGIYRNMIMIGEDTSNPLKGRKYVKVSNGIKAGFIEANTLQ